jgi:hypothetical protein
MTNTNLSTEHRQHFLDEGFSHDVINELVNNGLVRSMTPTEAAVEWFQVRDTDGNGLTGGIVFQFSQTYSQLRVDTPELIQKPGQKLPKYLSPTIPIDNNCAYIPEGCQVITEGMKDALAFSNLGGVPTGAISGVSHAVKALPAGCGYTILFDADAWENDKVFLNLIRAGVHCAGNVAILPPIDGEPKAGGCEYFKAGNTAEDFKNLIENSRSCENVVDEWLDHRLNNISDVKSAANLAVTAGKAFGELFGYATPAAKASIKTLVRSEPLKIYSLDLNAVYSSSLNTKEAQKAKAREEAGDNKPVILTLELVKEKCVFFHSQAPDSKGYVSIPTSQSIFKNVPVVSEAFENWFIGEYYSVSGEGLTKDSVNQVLATAKAIATHGSPQEFVSTKRVYPHLDRHFLYLGDEDQTVIEYSAKGWWVCLDSPVRFIADDHRGALPVPAKDGSIDKLWDFVRIVDISDRLLVLIFLVKLLFPGNTELLLCLSGYAGSGKTTAARFLRELIDPFLYGSVLGEIPDSKDELAIHCMKRCVVVIDNVSDIGKRMSDRLCRMLTGDGFTKRKLHTDLDEIALDCKSPLMMTAIGQVVTKSDLLQRTLAVELPTINDENRGSEKGLEDEFIKYHPRLLGGLLTLACEALAIKEKTECQTYARFTEFAHLGESVQAASKYPDNTLKNRLEQGVRTAHNLTIESSVVGSTLRSWIADLKKWDGSPTDLLNCLKSHAKKSDSSRTLPNLPNKLTSELRMIEQALNQEGIEINYKRKIAGQHIYVSTRLKSEILSTLPTFPGLESLETNANNSLTHVDAFHNPSTSTYMPSTSTYMPSTCPDKETAPNIDSESTSDHVDALKIHLHAPEVLQDKGYTDLTPNVDVGHVDTPQNLSTCKESLSSNDYSEKISDHVGHVDKKENFNGGDKHIVCKNSEIPQDPNNIETLDQDDEV